MRTIKVQYFFTVGEAAAFYVEHGGHGVITHTIGGKFKDCPPEREKDPVWLVEVFVNVTAQEIKEHEAARIAKQIRDDEDAAVAHMMAHGAPSEKEAREAYRTITAAFDLDELTHPQDHGGKTDAS